MVLLIHPKEDHREDVGELKNGSPEGVREKREICLVCS